MHYYEDMSISEISYAVGKSQNAVRSTLSQARRNIAGRLTATNVVVGAAMIPTAADITSGLRDGLSKVVDAEMLSRLMDHCHETISIAVPAATAFLLTHTKVIFLKAIAALTVTATMVCGLVGLNIISHSESAEAETISIPPTQAQEQTIKEPIYENTKITFVSDSECEHLNPRGAKLTGLSQPDAQVSYRIISGERTVAEGSGADATRDVTALVNAGQTGKYELIFDIVYDGGYTGHAKRTFEITEVS
jgi:hypothetical protein